MPEGDRGDRDAWRDQAARHEDAAVQLRTLVAQAQHAMMRPSGFHDGSRAGTTGGLRCVGSQFRFLSLLCWC